MRASCKVVTILAMVLGAYLLPFVRASAQEDVTQQVLERINVERASANLPPLARNAQLDAAAQDHANDLLKNGAQLGHRGSDGSTIRQRIVRAGYAGGNVGENWAGYRSLDKIFDFWLNDAPHRQNILNARYSEIGIGVAARANGGYIVVTDFGSPEIRAESNFVPPTVKPKKPRRKAVATAAPTKPRPTRTPISPTRQPTRKPTRRPTQIPPQLPTAAPIQVAIAPVLPKKMERLRVRAKFQKLSINAIARASVGALAVRKDNTHQLFGSALMLSGVALLGVALIGQRRRRTRW